MLVAPKQLKRQILNLAHLFRETFRTQTFKIVWKKKFRHGSNGIG